MSVKDAVLARLLNRRGEYLSGEELANALNVSRSAVWKTIGQLREDGYRIEAVTNRGYCLTGGDVLSREGILAHLRTPGLDVEVCPCVSSTNTLLKAEAENGAPEGRVIVAGEQTAGRGRLGRSFFSPPGTGLYLSLLLRPKESAEAALRITTAAAVAVCEAIEALSGREAKIKWVNDVYLDGKKVCGILTEASLDLESGGLHYAILGIGVNALTPEGGFPEDLREIAGAVFEAGGAPELRCRLAAEILDRFLACYRAEHPAALFERYRARCFVLGRRVTVLSGGIAIGEGEAVGLEQDYRLRLRYDDGTEGLLQSGEVSVLP